VHHEPLSIASRVFVRGTANPTRGIPSGAGFVQNTPSRVVAGEPKATGEE
jgi:hypothetical protein